MEEKAQKWSESMLTFSGDLRLRLYSIPIVPEELRKWNEKAYAPKLVSIGPRFKGRRELLPMEEVKMRFMQTLLSRTKMFDPGVDRTEFLNKNGLEPMLRLDTAIRACYVDEIKLDKYDLAIMMVLDGCFLLELLIDGNHEWNSRLEPQFKEHDSVVGDQVLTDLTLLENQIPLLVLATLFYQFFPGFCEDERKSYVIVENMALFFYGYYHFTMDKLYPPVRDPVHLLEVAHSPSLFPQLNEHSIDVIKNDGNYAVNMQPLKRCATRLQAAGVTIKRGIDPVGNKSFYFYANRPFKFNHIKYCRKNGLLEIPPLYITETTEGRWLNFIAWEHHKKKFKNSSNDRESCVHTFAALLFSHLICCASDVQLLQKRGVIVTDYNDPHMSNRDLVTFFHSIAKGVDPNIIDFDYKDILDALNRYSARNCTTRIHILLWHWLSRIAEWFYNLPKFLRRGYNFAAALITLLTIIQTFYAVFSYHHPSK